MGTCCHSLLGLFPPTSSPAMWSLNDHCCISQTYVSLLWTSSPGEAESSLDSREGKEGVRFCFHEQILLCIMFCIPCTFHWGSKTHPNLFPPKPSRHWWDMLVALRVRVCLSAEGETLSWAPVIYSFSLRKHFLQYYQHVVSFSPSVSRKPRIVTLSPVGEYSLLTQRLIRVTYQHCSNILHMIFI